MASIDNGNTLPFVTERDIIRQLASNLTKLTVTQQVKNNEKKIDSKLIMKENIGKVHKVWQAFCKFVRGQVVTSGRAVDTQLFGLIFKEQDHLMLLPSADYLEAGKFKFRQHNSEIDGIRSETM
jgi:hypothetical protein